MGGDGLGRGALGQRKLYAGAAAYQFWDYATIPAASVSRKGGTMKAKKIALLMLLGCALGPVAQAQIKHIEMRVEGMT